MNFLHDAFFDLLQFLGTENWPQTVTHQRVQQQEGHHTSVTRVSYHTLPGCLRDQRCARQLQLYLEGVQGVGDTCEQPDQEGLLLHPHLSRRASTWVVQ